MSEAMLRHIVLLCVIVTTCTAERTLEGPPKAAPIGVVVSQVTADGLVCYLGADGRPSEAQLSGIVPPQPGTQASANFVLFANYMTRQSHCTLVRKAGRGGVKEVQVILSDGRDLGYMLLLGRYATAHPIPEAAPTLYLTAKRTLQPDAIETIAARPSHE